MNMLEKGRLYILRKEATNDSQYVKIKNKRFLFGSSEHCTVRIYIDGIFPEHCVLSFGGQGKAYLEPLHPLALTLVNGIKIRHKVYLKDNDVITIFMTEFLFSYPPINLLRNVSLEKLILPHSKQIKPAQKFEALAFGKNLETSHPFRESSVSNINCIQKKRICIMKSSPLKEIPEYLFDFMHQKPVIILCGKMNEQEINCLSCSGKSLIKYTDQFIKKSPEERINLVLKLYEFISFLRGLLNMNEEYSCDLWLILESIWKYCIARTCEDILFLPLKSPNLKTEMAVHKKSLQYKTPSCTSENLLPVSNTVSENKNNLEISVSSDCKIDGQKPNQFSNRKISISYKKRVSLAVKRYHLRKRKSIMIAKAPEIQSVESLELSDERPQMKERLTEINSDGQDILNLKKLQITRTKRKRNYNKKKMEELQEEGNLKIKQDTNIEIVKDQTGEQNTTSKQIKGKRRNKKAPAKDTGLKPGKENIEKLMDNASGNQGTISNLREQKQSKPKQNSKNKDLKQESFEYPAGEQTTHPKLTETKVAKRSYRRKKKEAVTNNTDKSTPECVTQELSHCQRITRSMAKKYY